MLGAIFLICTTIPALTGWHKFAWVFLLIGGGIFTSLGGGIVRQSHREHQITQVGFVACGLSGVVIRKNIGYFLYFRWEDVTDLNWATNEEQGCTVHFTFPSREIMSLHSEDFGFARKGSVFAAIFASYREPPTHLRPSNLPEGSSGDLPVEGDLIDSVPNDD